MLVKISNKLTIDVDYVSHIVRSYEPNRLRLERDYGTMDVYLKNGGNIHLTHMSEAEYDFIEQRIIDHTRPTGYAAAT